MSEEKKYVFSAATRRRNARKRKLIGTKGMSKQQASHARGRIKAIATGIIKGDIATAINKADTRETIKRVGEYKAGAKKRGITPPRRDYKPPNHGRRKK